MKITKDFILQGFEDNFHKDAIDRLFDKVEQIQSVLISVAYVTAGGINIIEDKLKGVGKNKVTVFAGMGNPISTKEAFLLLHQLSENFYAVDTNSRQTIFHPKIYLVRGKSKARLLIGSANLTQGGLERNVEAGIVLELSTNEAIEIEKKFDKLPSRFKKHIFRVKNKDMINQWWDTGQLADGDKPADTSSVPKSEYNDTVSAIEEDENFHRPNKTHGRNHSKSKQPSKSTKSKSTTRTSLIVIDNDKYSEKQHVNKLNSDGKSAWEHLKIELSEICNENLIPTQKYITWKLGNDSIAEFEFERNASGVYVRTNKQIRGDKVNRFRKEVDRSKFKTVKFEYYYEHKKQFYFEKFFGGEAEDLELIKELLYKKYEEIKRVRGIN